ncbi:MAG: hypothetical protein HYR85_17825 [Planctomycetes bacterium]|nr:hypothetical protein [Planctomycetota bacterium]MBI3845177.1 hypothetical protein [Planctomycetota bacterium]
MTTAPEIPADLGFIRLDVRTLRADAVTRFSLFLENEAGEHILYRGPDIVLKAQALEGLLANGVRFIGVPKSERRAYQRYVEENLASMCDDPAIPLETKCELVYEAANSATERIFVDELSPQAIQETTRTILRPMATVLAGNESAVTAYVSQLRAETNLWTHAVNGCLLGILMVRKLHGVLDPTRLVDLGAGLLLRDIALKDAPPDLLDPGHVPTPEQKALYAEHPLRALEILRHVPFSEEARAMIAQHHERPDGSGFPAGLSGRQFHRFGQIAAVVDSFVTIYARRASGERRAAFHSMRETLDALGGHAEPELVVNFVLLFAKENPMRRWTPTPRL